MKWRFTHGLAVALTRGRGRQAGTPCANTFAYKSSNSLASAQAIKQPTKHTSHFSIQSGRAKRTGLSGNRGDEAWDKIAVDKPLPEQV